MAVYTEDPSLRAHRFYDQCANDCWRTYRRFVGCLDAVLHPSELLVNHDAQGGPLFDVKRDGNQWVLSLAGRTYRYEWHDGNEELMLTASDCTVCEPAVVPT